MVEITREELVCRVSGLLADDFDREDAEDLVDVLLEAFTASEAITWLCFIDQDLDGIPIALIEDGRGRDVLRYARGMVAIRSRA